MNQTQYDEIMIQSNNCHRKTIANKESWLIVPEDKTISFIAMFVNKRKSKFEKEMNYYEI